MGSSSTKPVWLSGSNKVEQCWRSPAIPEIVMFRGRYGHEFIPHSHDDVLTIVHVTDGSYQLQLDGVCHTVMAGDIAVIGAKQIHSAKALCSDGWAMQSLHAPTTFFMELAGVTFDSIKFRNPVVRNDGMAVSLFGIMHDQSALSANSEHIHQHARMFCSWFGDNFRKFAPERGIECLMDPLATKAKRLIEESIVEGCRMSIEEVAEVVGLSVFSLIRRFKRCWGIGPQAWRIQARTNLAANRLSRYNDSLSDVAVHCGFSDQAHMTRVFKTVYGVTPARYRNMYTRGPS